MFSLEKKFSMETFKQNCVNFKWCLWSFSHYCRLFTTWHFCFAKKKKKKKKNYIVGEKLENNKLEQFSGTQSFFNHHCPNCWQITEKLLAKISGLENKISIVPQALSEETTAKLELQHEVKTLYKKYKVVSDQLEKRLKN